MISGYFFNQRVTLTTLRRAFIKVSDQRLELEKVSSHYSYQCKKELFQFKLHANNVKYTVKILLWYLQDHLRASIYDKRGIISGKLVG